MDSQVWPSSCVRAIFLPTLLFWLAISAVAIPEEKPPAKTPNDSPAHRAVLRISTEILNSLIGATGVVRQADVRDVILGTSIHGTARIVATLGVKLA